MSAVLPPDSIRSLAGATETVLASAEQVFALGRTPGEPEIRHRTVTLGRQLLDIGKAVMRDLTDNPRGLAHGFAQVLEASETLTNIAATEPDPEIRQKLLAIARSLAEAGSSVPSALESTISRRSLP